jgi:type II secretory pathway pseudopilin PulG
MTLVEIMISLVLLGIVSGVIMRVIMRQQRFYQGVNQIMTERGQLRQATSVLPTDLRSLSSIGNDILVASDSSIDFMVNVGTGVVCEVVDGATVALPPLDLASGQTLTSWFGSEPPAQGSTVYIYNDSIDAGGVDDRWQKFTLSSISEDASKCPATFTRVEDLPKKRELLHLTSDEALDPVTGGPLSQYINVGAPVRILKPVRYALFQYTDGKWYLGYATYNTTTSAYDPLEPVSGPYDPYSGGGGSGLVFRYYDVNGNEIAAGADSAARSRIARIDLVARAHSADQVRTAGIQNGKSQLYRDSLAVSVMLRNRR